MDFRMMIKVVYLFLAFAATNVLSQEVSRMQLRGKVTTEVSALEGLYVINKATEMASISDYEVNFSIPAGVGNTLLFTATQFKETKIRATQNHLERGILNAKVSPVMNQ